MHLIYLFMYVTLYKRVTAVLVYNGSSKQSKITLLGTSSLKAKVQYTCAPKRTLEQISLGTPRLNVNTRESWRISQSGIIVYHFYLYTCYRHYHLRIRKPVRDRKVETR
jgi:hypothetical protein